MNEEEKTLEEMTALLDRAGDLGAAFTGESPVFVVEDMTDALQLLQVGANAVGVGMGQKG